MKEAQGLGTDGAWRGTAERPSRGEQSGLQAAHSVSQSKYSQPAMANGRFMQSTREVASKPYTSFKDTHRAALNLYSRRCCSMHCNASIWVLLQCSTLTVERHSVTPRP